MKKKRDFNGSVTGTVGEITDFCWHITGTSSFDKSAHETIRAIVEFSICGWLS
jgi:hypothetical protein